MSGMDIFGKLTFIEGILNLEPLIFPSGPSMSNSGASISTLGPDISKPPFGSLTSTSGPSNLGPEKPNLGILNFGIFSFPSGPSRSTPGISRSTSGTLMSSLGPFISASTLGTDTSTSPFQLGPFKFRSKSGIDTLGRCMVGILNLGPFTFPSTSKSGASRSHSGPFRSPSSLVPDMSASPFHLGPLRFRSMSGIDTLGKLTFIEGILNFEPFTFPSGPLMSNSGASRSSSGPFRSPSNLCPEMSAPPFHLGPFRFRSMSGMDILGKFTFIEGMLNLEPLIFPSGPPISSPGASISTFVPEISRLPFGNFTSTCGPSTLGPDIPNLGI
ncbi:hypothetical protein FKM82_030176 [Ascaphus truei]